MYNSKLTNAERKEMVEEEIAGYLQTIQEYEDELEELRRNLEDAEQELADLEEYEDEEI